MKMKNKTMTEPEKILYILDILKMTNKDEQRKEEIQDIIDKLDKKLGKVQPIKKVNES